MEPETSIAYVCSFVCVFFIYDAVIRPDGMSPNGRVTGEPRSERNLE